MKNSIPYEKIYHHELLNKVIDDYIHNQFLASQSVSRQTITVKFEDVRKCIWLCSILASSENESHRKKVQLFAALVYLQNIENIDIERASFLLLSRTGNLTATRLFNNYSEITSLDTNNNSIHKYDALLNLELALSWNDKLVRIKGEEFITTRFQKDLWVELNRSNRISISAPTSAGKSFIIKKFIKNKLTQSDSFIALYIVPSRALINQVSEEFRKEVNLEEVEIRTAFIEDKISPLKKKQIFILTAERCLRLIRHALQTKFFVDFIFVDEIQNIENEDGRGSVFEHVLRELSSIFPKAQIVTAGPNIEKSADLFNSVFNEISIPVETSVSPVFQIKTILRPLKGNKMKISIRGAAKREQIFEIETPTDFFKKINESYAEGLPDIIDLFTKNQQNIIYSPKTNYVEEWALRYVENTKEINASLFDQNKELIEFLEDEIHPRYYLIKCLQKGSAFHHSKLPDIVRKEIEDGFLDGRINNLFCTSTLLEGVNMPANNLFVVSPKKLDEELSPFEFGNLIGRAGRIKDSLYGTIFCVQRNEDDNWAENYYDQTLEKEVKSVSTKALVDFEALLSQAQLEANLIEVPRNANTIIFLRHKFLKGSRVLKKYLVDKELGNGQAERLLNEITLAMQEIVLPPEVARINPSIDPILQNKLYLRIKELGISNWVITYNSNFYEKIGKDLKDEYPFEELNFYWQLVGVMELLDEIFQLRSEAFFKHSISISIRQACYYVMKWISTSSYKKLIEDDIAFYAEHTNLDKRINPNDDKQVNVRINEIIKINSTVTTYVFVKYLKLLNDIIEPMMNDEQREKYKFSLSLPTKIELGTSEDIVIQLISRGISRSVALKIFREFKKVYGYKDLNVFEWLKSKQSLGLKPIYNRHLISLRLLKGT